MLVYCHNKAILTLGIAVLNVSKQMTTRRSSCSSNRTGSQDLVLNQFKWAY